MLTRILAVTLAAGSLAFATAHAQTGTGTPGSNQSHQQMAPSPQTTQPSTAPTTAQTTGMPGSGSTDSDKTRPSAAPPTEPSQIHQPMNSGSSGKTGPSGGPAANSSGQSQAQQLMGSGRFDPSQHKTKTECLNAASAARASFNLCSSLK
jgi:hypothetical protein